METLKSIKAIALDCIVLNGFAIMTLQGCQGIVLTHDAAQASYSKPLVYSADFTPPVSYAGGIDGTLNAKEIRDLLYLKMPQQYDSIKARFGLPKTRDSNRDYYQIEGTARWIAVRYSDGIAVAIEIGQ